MFKQLKQLDKNTDSRNHRKATFAKTALSMSFSTIAFFMASTSASAACKGVNCVCQDSSIEYAAPALEKNADGEYPISLEADSVEAEGEKLVTLSGNAEVTQGRQTIVADKLQYYRDSERVVANGSVEMISQNGSYLSSESIDIHVPTQIGSLTDADFKLADNLIRTDGVDTVKVQSRGSASLVNLEGEGVVYLENAQYTTCPEGNDSVMIGAKELTLDQLGGIGTARNATIHFKGLPIFYFPYVTFPINDERKTGFLIPGIGTDNESGLVVDVPWYWNIAKNQDATFTPKYYSNRGLQLSTEYRLRTQNSAAYVLAEVLPDDEIFGETRSLLSVQYSHEITENLSASINYNDLSDISYYFDLSNELRYFSSTSVPRDFRLNYSHEYFDLNARAIEYQAVDGRIATSLYERRPAISFSTNLPEGPYGLEYGINASYTDFVSETRQEGTRTSISPYAELPLENIWGYIKPAVSLNNRSYSLSDVDEGVDDNPSFSVPIFSIDTGVYFEKNTNWFGDSVLQTLEPRLFYVYAPEEEDQETINTFDTTVVRLNNFSNIFRQNRFYGEDRIGDTNQITLGLTTTITDNETGDQRLKASIGQLYLIDDQEVGLRSTTEANEKGFGDFLAEIRTESDGPWSTYAFIQYDHEESDIVSSRFTLGYEPEDDSRKNVNVSYFKSERSVVSQDIGARIVDQLSVDVNWPISDRWQFFGSERYSIEDSESYSRTAGLEYNGCCWKVRFIGTDRINTIFQSTIARNLDNIEDDRRTSFFVEFELTALGKLRTGL